MKAEHLKMCSWSAEPHFRKVKSFIVDFDLICSTPEQHKRLGFLSRWLLWEVISFTSGSRSFKGQIEKSLPKKLKKIHVFVAESESEIT